MTRTALVTGGNRGLGYETCRQLKERGLRVILTARRAEEAKEAASDLEVEHRTLDVSDPKSVEALAADLTREDVRLDALVNNAGVALDGFDARVARRTIDTNFHGAARVTDALLPRIEDGGAIVMVSSGLGELTAVSKGLRARFLDPELTRAQLEELMESFVRDVEAGHHTAAGWPSSAYSVSKVGLNALTRILAKQLAPRHIHVNAVCPGWVRTDMGGPGAERPIEEGASGIVWAATLEGDAPTGAFFRDEKKIGW